SSPSANDSYRGGSNSGFEVLVSGRPRTATLDVSAATSMRPYDTATVVGRHCSRKRGESSTTPGSGRSSFDSREFTPCDEVESRAHATDKLAARRAQQRFMDRSTKSRSRTRCD